MIEQHSYSGDYTNRYKFNGKELDEETGFYYYGARYYNPKFSIWLSVDPLAEKFPHQSPYVFTDNNPINLIDPDGRAAAKPPLKGTKDFNDFVKDVVNKNSSPVNWSDKDGTWRYDAKKQSWIGIDESKGNNISFNKKIISDDANKAASAVSTGSGVKDLLIEGAVAQSSNTKIYNVTDDIVSATSGVGAAKYLKYSKGAGVLLGAVGTAYSTNEAINQYQSGGMNEVMQHRDGLDATVGAVGLGATALTTLGIISNPVGWGIGIGCLAYGAGCLIYDAVTEEKK